MTKSKAAQAEAASKPKRPTPKRNPPDYTPRADFGDAAEGHDRVFLALNHAMTATCTPGRKSYNPFENIYYWNLAFVGWYVFDFRPCLRGKPAVFQIAASAEAAEKLASEINFDQTDNEEAAAPVAAHVPPEDVVEKKRGFFARLFSMK